MPTRHPAATLSRDRVRAYRILASGLARNTSIAGDLPVWDLGVQDRDGSARVAMAARLPDPHLVPNVDEPAGTGWATMAWTLRGSPYLHRRSDLGRLAAALWPADEADAAARLVADAGRLLADGADPLDAYVVVADTMRAVITEPTVKGAASAAVTAALPGRFSGFCPGCGSIHVREFLFRLAALPASIGIVPDTKPVVLAPLSDSFPRPQAQRGLAVLASEYYRRYGIGTNPEVATSLGTSATCIKPAVPDDLVPVTVDGARSQARSGLLDDLRDADLAAAAAIVRLLPPSDPLLQPRDRAVLTTDRAQQKALWPALGLPGAVLAGGGLAGIWRTRAAGAVLTITITPWRRLTRAECTAVEDEAQVVGTVRGMKRTSLAID